MAYNSQNFTFQPISVFGDSPNYKKKKKKTTLKWHSFEDIMHEYFFSDGITVIHVLNLNLAVVLFIRT